MSGARLAGVALGVLALAGAGTYLAGEQTEVVVLRSYDGEGKPHDTKLWAVDHEGVPWVHVETRAAIDRLFREKYGIVDGWYGVLLRRHALPVRLEPVP